MAISQDFIQQLKSRHDIVSIISSYVNLKRHGRGHTGLCPFHSEKTPSFTVYPDTQSFYCFGCGAGGDVITFVRQIENLDYVEAVKFLADKAGLPMPEDGYDDSAARLRTRILELNREAARFFHQTLLSADGARGRSYLVQRGLSPKIITKYGLGYAPDRWNDLMYHLQGKGFSRDEMEKAAVIVRRAKSAYDKFRDRVMFPIIDIRGNVVAFGGRRLGEQGPKYMNSDDTPVFKKSRNLFSLNFAKNVKERRLILAEGYMDVISIFQGGFENVVATLGTALTGEQARLISQYADEVVIAYDSDQAGQAATRRAIGLLGEVGVKTRILRMEGAKDPDEFIKKFGATRFKLLLDGSSNATDFMLSKAREAVDMDTQDGKVDFLKKAVQVLADLSNPLEREVYMAQIAQELSISKDVMSLQVGNVLKSRRKKEAAKEWESIATNQKAYADKINPQSAQYPREARAEEGIIAYLFKNPDALAWVEEQNIQDLFVTDFNRSVYDAICMLLHAGADLSLSALSSSFTPVQMGRISGILAKSSETVNEPQQLADYIDVLRQHKDKWNADDIKHSSVDDLRRLQNQIKSQKFK